MRRVSSSETLPQIRVVQLRRFPVYLVEEANEPTEQIIAELLSFRDGAVDDVHENAELVQMPELVEDADYPSESESQDVWMEMNSPALPGIPIPRPYAQH